MFPGNKMKAVTFSYDDGITQDRRLVEMFNRYGLKGTFNLNTAVLDGGLAWTHPCGVPIYHLTEEQAKELYVGHEVACHALHHEDLTKMSAEAVADNMRQDMANIERIFGQKAYGMAYPGGFFNDTAQEGLRQAGIQYARTVISSRSFEPQQDLLRFEPTCYHVKDKEVLFELARDFIALKPDSPKIFYIWGHSYEFDVFGDWDEFESFCQLISGHDDMFYGTNAQVLLGAQ